eukprot:gene11589-biopygen5006
MRERRHLPSYHHNRLLSWSVYNTIRHRRRNMVHSMYTYHHLQIHTNSHLAGHTSSMEATRVRRSLVT